MSSDGLTSEQQAFLDKCNLEFSNRFTDGDLEFKKIYDDGIPDPPIMCPWYGKQRNRNWGHGSRNYGRDSYDNNFRENNRHRQYNQRSNY